MACILVIFFSPIAGLKGGGTQSELDQLHLPGLSGMENLPNLVSLCAIFEFLNVLHFDSYGPTRMAPEEQLMAVHTRHLARTTFQWFLNRCELQVDDNGWRNSEVVRGTCVHWAKGLLAAKMHSDASGINPRVPGFTVDALRRELDGCLGIGWEIEPGPTPTTFMLVRTMRVVGPKKISPLSRMCFFCFFLMLSKLNSCRDAWQDASR
jgi:hypothetical protein